MQGRGHWWDDFISNKEPERWTCVRVSRTGSCRTCPAPNPRAHVHFKRSIHYGSSKAPPMKIPRELVFPAWKAQTWVTAVISFWSCIWRMQSAGMMAWIGAPSIMLLSCNLFMIHATVMMIHVIEIQRPREKTRRIRKILILILIGRILSHNCLLQLLMTAGHTSEYFIHITDFTVVTGWDVMILFTWKWHEFDFCVCG